MFTGKFVKTLLITSTLIGLPAMAQGNTEKGQVTQVKVGGESCARAGFERRGEFGKKMGFTDVQLEKMAALKDKARVDTATEKAQLKTLNDQLKVAITKSDVSAQDDLALQGKINGLRDQIATQKLQEKLDFIAILTPEQRDTLRHKILVSEVFGMRGGPGQRAEHGGRFGHHMHHHFGNRPTA